MTIKKVLIETNTAWCGEDLHYRALVDDKHMKVLEDIAQLSSYDSFSDFGGFESMMEELFPEGKEGEEGEEWSDEQLSEGYDRESEYFHLTISDFEGTDEEWEYYEWMYDCTKDKK